MTPQAANTPDEMRDIVDATIRYSENALETIAINTIKSYVDDGYSGTNFNRPAFQRMLQDAKDKRINLILVKDLSRLGRNYIEVGKLTDETLPELGCRFIALNDSVDTFAGDNDMMVYRNLFNEFYSRDTSKKVRTVKKSLRGERQILGNLRSLRLQKKSR